jgi:hypothetical protein
MNKSLESVRGSWITRDREIAEANREFLRSAGEQIPADLHEKIISIVEWAERIEQSNDVIVDAMCKDSDRSGSEIMFLEAQIKILIEAIRVTKDVESIKALRTVTRETIERMREHTFKEEQERLQAELALRGTVATSPARTSLEQS